MGRADENRDEARAAAATLNAAALAYAGAWSRWHQLLLGGARAEAEVAWGDVVDAERLHQEAAVRFTRPPARK